MQRFRINDHKGIQMDSPQHPDEKEMRNKECSRAIIFNNVIFYRCTGSNERICYHGVKADESNLCSSKYIKITRLIPLFRVSLMHNHVLDVTLFIPAHLLMED